jgi:hypothetical protein
VAVVVARYEGKRAGTLSAEAMRCGDDHIA